MSWFCLNQVLAEPSWDLRINELYPILATSFSEDSLYFQEDVCLHKFFANHGIRPYQLLCEVCAGSAEVQTARDPNG